MLVGHGTRADAGTDPVFVVASGEYDSTRGSTSPLLSVVYWPTATHLVVVRQDTAESWLAEVPEFGTGVSWTVQSDPREPSANGLPVPDALSYSPTAVQSVATEHEISASAPDVPPLGVGVGCSDHLAPFHLSAKPLAAALHAFADVHEMPPRKLKVLPDGLGVFWIDQLVPFHFSASVSEVVVPPWSSP